MSQIEHKFVEVSISTIDNPKLWQPKIGQETLDLLDQFSIPVDERNLLKDEAVSILANCVQPEVVTGKRTGLVVGYVQSGKTMSFTTVTALACDNNYQLVIVITGSKVPLLNQSTDRLKRDLRLNSRQDRQWIHFESKQFSKKHAEMADKLRSVLNGRMNASTSNASKRTILLTVMKNHIHLKDVCTVLEQLDLQNVATLIIDDEADQASLNAKVNQGEVTTTYSWLVRLKEQLPHHTFLQYTATPQAPLLINLIDVLSPQFVVVLTPGNGYTGGKEFFLNAIKLVRAIPRSEVFLDKDPLNAPPDSLLYAMRLFFVGVASELVQRNDMPVGNRSMMIHPSRKQEGHQINFKWIKNIQKNWLEGLTSIDREELLADFRVAYDDLGETAFDLPAFEQITERIYEAINQTFVEEVNSRRSMTPTINWKANYSYILVGGQAMDRGFTVEGLTVTYMPRNTGVGNADTIQQRARFFGYKKAYLGYCRVFLEQDVLNAFSSYVSHEEDIRSRLIDHTKTGKPLTDWKRAFFLDMNLKPTRKSVLSLDYLRGNFADDWFTPKAPHDSPETSSSNRQLVERFLENLNTLFANRYSHKYATNVPLSAVYRDLLIPFRLTRMDDSLPYIGLLLQIGAILEEEPSASCTIYIMNDLKQKSRSTDPHKNEIKQLFEGRRPGKNVDSYPGDREMKTQHELTIQIHNLEVKSQVGILKNVPTLAIWVPQKLRNAWLVQE